MHHAWFVARFLSGYEEPAARALDRGEPGARSFCPLETRRWQHRGRQLERCVPVLSGYVFVEMTRNDVYRWHGAAEQPGFLGFIGGELPQPALDGRVEDLLSRVTETWLLELDTLKVVASDFDRGDRVRVTEGFLENLIGHVEWTRRHPDYGPVAQVLLRGLFAGEVRAELSVQCLELDGHVARPRSLLDLPIVREVVALA